MSDPNYERYRARRAALEPDAANSRRKIGVIFYWIAIILLLVSLGNGIIGFVNALHADPIQPGTLIFTGFFATVALAALVVVVVIVTRTWISAVHRDLPAERAALNFAYPEYAERYAAEHHTNQDDLQTPDA